MTTFLDKKWLSVIAGGASMLGLAALARRFGLLEKINGRSELTTEVSVDVYKDRAEVYQYWRKLENLPVFMKYLDDVTVKNDISEWTTKDLTGVGKISWKAKIVHEEENRLIVWYSLPGSQIHTSGKVLFEDLPDEKGTRITATFSYGKSEKDLANTYAKLLKIVNVKEIKADMRRFKNIMETGALPEISE